MLEALADETIILSSNPSDVQEAEVRRSDTESIEQIVKALEVAREDTAGRHSLDVDGTKSLMVSAYTLGFLIGIAKREEFRDQAECAASHIATDVEASAKRDRSTLEDFEYKIAHGWTQEEAYKYYKNGLKRIELARAAMHTTNQRKSS